MSRRIQFHRPGVREGILIGLVFIAVGGGLLFYFSSSYLNSLHFPTASCTILTKSIITGESDDIDDFTPQFSLRVQPDNGMAAYQTKSNYNLTGNTTTNHSDVISLMDRFTVGQQYQCWYNPQNRFETILDRSPNLWQIGVGALFGFVGLIVFLSAIRIELLLAWGLRFIRR